MFKSTFDKTNKNHVPREIIDIPNKNMLIDFGFLKNVSDNKFFYPTHFHDELEFIYIVEGQFDCIIDGKTYKVNKDNLVAILPNLEHSLTQTGKECKFYNFLFDYSFFNSRYIDDCEEKYIMPWLSNVVVIECIIANNKVISTYIKKMIKELENKKEGYELYTKSCIFYILAELFRNHIILDNRVSNHNGSDKMKIVLRYIEDNFNEKLDLDKVAAMSKLNKFEFCRQFKIATGRSFIDYLNYFRIRESLSLLKNTNKSIAEIAISVGYEDFSYYSRIFKKYILSSPSEYRLSK